MVLMSSALSPSSDASTKARVSSAVGRGNAVPSRVMIRSPLSNCASLDCPDARLRRRLAPYAARYPDDGSPPNGYLGFRPPAPPAKRRRRRRLVDRQRDVGGER